MAVGSAFPGRLEISQAVMLWIDSANLFRKKGYVQVIWSDQPFSHIYPESTTTQSLQLKFVIANRSPLLWGKYPYRSPKTAHYNTRWAELGTVVMHETNLKTNLASWSWCTWICHMIVDTNEVSCFLLSKGSSSFSMIFWYILCICVRD